MLFTYTFLTIYNLLQLNDDFVQFEIKKNEAERRYDMTECIV